MPATRRHWRWLPLFESSPWGGDMDDGRGSVSGWSVSVAWLSFYLEFIVAREEA